MPWPFRRHRPREAGAAQRASAPSGRPVTVDDLAGARRLTVHAGNWQTLEPLRPSATGAAAPVVSSGASFIAHLAGTQPLLPTTSLREVSSDAPRGLTHGLAHPLPSAPRPSPPENVGAEAPPSAEHVPAPAATRRPVVASGAPTHAALTSFTGELTPAQPEPEPESDVFVGPDLFDDELPEELPPPIFSTLLAERTGRELSELRPDLADGEADGAQPASDDIEVTQRVPRRSLAESRRLGLGAPLPSGPFEVGNRERIEEEAVELEAPAPEALSPEAPPEPEVPEVGAPPEPARRAVAHYRSVDVPPEVRTDVTRALGRDPGAVRVRREREVSDVASRIGARAFTRQGEVFLPAEAGPLDSPETRAVLAHELTHVVQHRVYGSSLPRASSPAGQRLEAEAQAVERFVRGDDPEPLVAPIRTLRATPGDPRVDSGGFTRAVTEQLVARGAAQWDAEGALVFQPPQGLSDEWRAPSGGSGNDAFQTALRDDQRATTEYARSRSGPAPATDRAENDRHLRFVHEWQGQIRNTGGAASEDARLSLAYESSRRGNADATIDSPEFERHLRYVNDSGGGEEEEEIVLVSGGLGTAMGLLGGITDHYDRTQAMISVDREHQRQEQLLADMRKAQGQGTAAPQTATPTTGTTTSTPSTPTQATPTQATPTTSAMTPGAWLPHGGTDAHWEDDDDIKLPDPASGKDTGWGAALGLLAPVMGKYDADYTHDSHFGQHLVPAQPATPPTTPAGPATPVMTPTAATPTTTAPVAAPAPAAPAVATAATAVAAGAHADATHHELAAAGSRPRERSIEGSDPTDVVAHLDDQDLEDLATLLFDRLQTRLRRDLIVGRERSGFLTDFR